MPRSTRSVLRQRDRDEVPDAVAVLDAFHVVKLASTALDEVRRRVQQATLGRRGHKDDPLYRIRRTLLTGVEHLTDRQRARLEKHLPVGDPDGEVELAWSVSAGPGDLPRRHPPQGSRARRETPRHPAHLPGQGVARLGRTPRQWRAAILAYFTTDGVSNGGTEAINGGIEKTRRLAHGFRNFTNYRTRILLAADGTRPYRRSPWREPQPC